MTEPSNGLLKFLTKDNEIYTFETEEDQTISDLAQSVLSQSYLDVDVIDDEGNERRCVIPLDDVTNMELKGGFDVLFSNNIDNEIKQSTIH